MADETNESTKLDNLIETIEREPALLLNEAEAEVDAVHAAVTRAVDGFIAAHLRNSAFAQATAAWNHFQAGLPALIESIVKEVKGL